MDMETKIIITIFCLAAIAFLVLYLLLDAKYGYGKGSRVVYKDDLEKLQGGLENDTIQSNKC